jgi:hypothetical protein
MRRFAVPAALLLAACQPPRAVQVPSYEPRAIVVPAECDALVQRAAALDAARLTEAEFRTVTFCQHQQLIRAQEEEAAARRLEAHARTAGLALQAVTVVVGATVALLTWVF